MRVETAQTAKALAQRLAAEEQAKDEQVKRYVQAWMKYTAGKEIPDGA